MKFIVIPESIDKNKNLTIKEKYLIAILICLCFEYGYCSPTNEYLAEKLGLKHRNQISPYLANLAKLKLIIIKLRQHYKRSISVNPKLLYEVKKLFS